jgi:predicted MFS family arabinose efflux permease
VFALACGSFSLAIGVLVLAGKYPASALPFYYAVLLGIGYAITSPITPAIASDLFAGPGFSTIFGASHCALGFGTALGAWAGGEIFDQTGSYAAALWGAFSLTCFSCLLLWLVAPRRPNPPPQ